MARGWRLPGGVSPAWRLRAALCHSGPWMAKEGGVGRDGSPEGGPHPGRDAGLAGRAIEINPQWFRAIEVPNKPSQNWRAIRHLRDHAARVSAE